MKARKQWKPWLIVEEAMAIMLRRGWSWYLSQLSQRPVRTQMITSGCLWAMGDVAAQHIDFTLKNDSHSHESTFQECEEIRASETVLDWKRVASCSSFGFGFVGPVGHFWYEGLERYVKHKLRFRPNTFKFIGSKVLADGFIFGPIDLLVFFSYMDLLMGRSLDQLKHDLKRDFVPAFMTEGAIWPIIQVLNFRFVPVRHQLLFVNAFCLLDSAFLSWFKHQNDAPWKQWLSSFVFAEGKP